MDLTKYHLQNNITKELLSNNGFKQLNKNTYMIFKDLFENSICIQMFVHLQSGEIEIDVIDKNTMKTYAPFWNNINGSNNLVAIRTIKNFYKYMNELQKNNIINIEEKNVG